jgi:hypothetical protein
MCDLRLQMLLRGATTSMRDLLQMLAFFGYFDLLWT